MVHMGSGKADCPAFSLDTERKEPITRHSLGVPRQGLQRRGISEVEHNGAVDRDRGAPGHQLAETGQARRDMMEE